RLFFCFLSGLRLPIATLIPYTTLFRSLEFLKSLHLPDWIIEQMYIDGVYYHPTFLYESLWNLTGFLLLLLLRRVNPKRGEILFRSESTRLNSSHVKISYAVFCLKKKI